MNENLLGIGALLWVVGLGVLGILTILIPVSVYSA